MQKAPYIGITDFTSEQEVKNMKKVFELNRPVGNTRQLHVGVMMSQKTLHNHPTKWANIFPKKEQLAEIFSVKEVMNCLHYADYENRKGTIVWGSLTEVIEWGGLGLTSLQLDMIWPDPNDIFKALYAGRRILDVVLQVGQRAFEEIEYDKQKLVDYLEEYVDQGVIDYVLLDLSMGQGKEMKSGFLLPFLEVIQNHYPNLGLAVAGGLGPDTMHLIEPIVREFPDISIDAQGKLRPSGNAMDPIDWKMASTYLQESLKILR